MRHRGYLKVSLLGVLGVVAALGAASAQGNPAAPVPPSADAEVGMQREVRLSPEEQVAEGNKIVAGIDTARNVVRSMLEKARVTKPPEVVKSLCLDDKLNQIDVARRSAVERLASLDSAAKRQDDDLSAHEFTILSVLKQRVAQLHAEAHQCIGREGDILGEAEVIVSVDPNLPQVDPSEYPADDMITLPPQCVSCTN